MDVSTLETDDPTGAQVRLTAQERESRHDELDRLVAVMRETVQMDGGDLYLVSADVETGVVEVQLSGSCSSCAISSVTLAAGVERALRDRLSWVTDVRGSVDDSFDEGLSRELGQGVYIPK
jgi:Fe-S cluster biogenesis protein NfuA